MIVRIAADWDTSSLLSQTSGSSGLWDGIHFTTSPVPECDLLVVLNNRQIEDIRVRCPRANVWCIIQEPYVPGLYDWMIEGLDPYSLVFTHHLPSVDPKFVPSHPALPWLIGRNYDELSTLSCPKKLESISWIASDLAFLPAHRHRRQLRQYINTHARDLVRLYGRGIEYLPRKWDGLAPYRYSVCIENSVGPHLWSEKLADCFLAWTVPLYSGCTNLEEYFPLDSFIRLPIADPPTVCDTIRQILATDDWSRRLPAIEAARQSILERYQLFPFIAQQIQTRGLSRASREDILVPSYTAARRRHRFRYLGSKIKNAEFAEMRDALISKGKYLWWSH